MIRWKDCFVKTYEAIGSQVCSAAHIDFFDQYTYKSTIEPLNVFCSDIDESDKCDKFRQFLTDSADKRVKYGTPFPALISIFENL